jgi:enoyl-CoA hydratase
VHGWAIGAGFQYPLWGDIIYASESAKFQLPQVELGIMPAYVGAVQLSQFVGRGATSEAALLGEPIDSEDALRLGLVQEVCPDKTSLIEYAAEQARELAEKPPASVRLTKESIRMGMEQPLTHAGIADRYRFYALSETSDSKQIHEEKQDEHSS